MATLEIDVPAKGTKAWKWIQKTFQFREGLKDRLSPFLNEHSAEKVANEFYSYWLEHFQYEPIYAFDPVKDENKVIA